VKRLRLLIALAGLCGAFACAHVPAVVDCAAVDVGPYAAEVATDLSTSNWADLDALALDKGVPFVVCLVRAILGKTSAGPSAEFGHAWIKAHGG
jgi:hypothetical protein